MKTLNKSNTEAKNTFILICLKALIGITFINQALLPSLEIAVEAAKEKDVKKTPTAIIPK